MGVEKIPKPKIKNEAESTMHAFIQKGIAERDIKNRLEQAVKEATLAANAAKKLSRFRKANPFLEEQKRLEKLMKTVLDLEDPKNVPREYEKTVASHPATKAKEAIIGKARKKVLSSEERVIEMLDHLESAVTYFPRTISEEGTIASVDEVLDPKAFKKATPTKEELISMRRKFPPRTRENMFDEDISIPEPVPLPESLPEYVPEPEEEEREREVDAETEETHENASEQGIAGQDVLGTRWPLDTLAEGEDRHGEKEGESRAAAKGNAQRMSAEAGGVAVEEREVLTVEAATDKLFMAARRYIEARPDTVKTQADLELITEEFFTSVEAYADATRAATPGMTDVEYGKIKSEISEGVRIRRWMSIHDAAETQRNERNAARRRPIWTALKGLGVKLGIVGAAGGAYHLSKHPISFEIERSQDEGRLQRVEPQPGIELSNPTTTQPGYEVDAETGELRPLAPHVSITEEAQFIESLRIQGREGATLLPATEAPDQR